MSPEELKEKYNQLLQVTNAAAPGACSIISLRLPDRFEGELAFSKLVAWSFALLFESARVPVVFFGALGKVSVGDIKKDVASLRTYLSHNLDVGIPSDRKTLERVRAWHQKISGIDSPRTEAEYTSACIGLAQMLGLVLDALFEAAKLLNDEIDGPGLQEDLISRVSLDWPAHRFDRVAENVALRLGVNGVDIRKLRENHLDAWRGALKAGEKGNEIRALELAIEATLLVHCDGKLSVTSREALSALRLESRDSLILALLAIREAERNGVRDIPEVLAHIKAR